MTSTYLEDLPPEIFHNHVFAWLDMKEIEKLETSDSSPPNNIFKKFHTFNSQIGPRVVPMITSRINHSPHGEKLKYRIKGRKNFIRIKLLFEDFLRFPYSNNRIKDIQDSNQFVQSILSRTSDDTYNLLLYINRFQTRNDFTDFVSSWVLPLYLDILECYGSHHRYKECYLTVSYMIDYDIHPEMILNYLWKCCPLYIRGVLGVVRLDSVGSIQEHQWCHKVLSCTTIKFTRELILDSIRFLSHGSSYHHIGSILAMIMKGIKDETLPRDDIFEIIVFMVMSARMFKYVKPYTGEYELTLFGGSNSGSLVCFQLFCQQILSTSDDWSLLISKIKIILATRNPNEYTNCLKFFLKCAPYENPNSYLSNVIPLLNTKEGDLDRYLKFIRKTFDLTPYNQILINSKLRSHSREELLD